MARRDTTSGASTPNIGLSATAASVAAVAIKRERRALAQAQQARGLVDLGAGEHHRVDRAAALAVARMQRRRRLDLRAQIGRGVEQRPALAVGRHREARLRARRARADRRPRPAGRRRSCSSIAESRRPPPHRARWRSVPSRREAEARSEFGRQIAVDLEADADLDEGRGGPGHGVSSAVSFVANLTHESAGPLRCKGRSGSIRRKRRHPSPRGPLVLVHAGFLDDLAPFLALGPVEGVEILRRPEHRRKALGGQRLLDFGRFQRLLVGIRRACWMMSFGVPAGAVSPIQSRTSKPG